MVTEIIHNARDLYYRENLDRNAVNSNNNQTSDVQGIFDSDSVEVSDDSMVAEKFNEYFSNL